MTDAFMYPTQVASGSQDFSWGWFLFSAKGRISRSDYWLRFFLPYIGITIFFGLAIELLSSLQLETGAGIISLLYLIFILVSAYSSIVIVIKRWHDRDKSGWWILIIFVPIIGGIWFFVEGGCMEGTRGPNRFGPSRFPSEQNINQVFE